MNFKKTYDEFIVKTHANSSEQYRPSALSHVIIKGKEKLCTECFCFKKAALIIDLTKYIIIGQFTKKREYRQLHKNISIIKYIFLSKQVNNLLFLIKSKK